MALSPELQAAYGDYWQLTQAVANDTQPDGSYTYRSTDLVSIAYQVAEDNDVTLPSNTPQQLLQLFSVARGNARASDDLTAADPTASITGSMVGNWPTAAPESVQDVQPLYMAKGQFTYTNALGEQQTGWVTITNITAIPPTAGNLANRLQGAAQQQYSLTPQEGGTPKTDAEVMTEFGELTSMQLYAV